MVTDVALPRDFKVGSDGAWATSVCREKAKPNSSMANAVVRIAKRAHLSNQAISPQAETILRFLTVDNPGQLDFPSLFKLCRLLPKEQVSILGSNDASTPNDPGNALTQLYVAQKPEELPSATHLLAQMRQVLTWKALQDTDNQSAVRKVIQRLNEKMGCASQNLQYNIDYAFLETNHASLELFCDLMTHQDSDLQSDTTRNRTTSLLFNACPPENLENLLEAFKQAAVEPTHSQMQQFKFKNMSACLELAIETTHAINKIRDGKLFFQQLNEVQKNNPDMLMAIVKKNHQEIWSIDSTTENYEEFAFAAVKKDAWAIELIELTVKNYFDIALEAVKQNGLTLQHVDPRVENYGEIVLFAVKEDGLALEFAGEEFTRNLKIIVAALKQNKEAIRFVAPDMRQHPEVLKVCPIHKFSKPTIRFSLVFR